MLVTLLSVYSKRQVNKLLMDEKVHVTESIIQIITQIKAFSFLSVTFKSVKVHEHSLDIFKCQFISHDQ